jgi:hypothetical protein
MLDYGFLLSLLTYTFSMQNYVCILSRCLDNLWPQVQMQGWVQPAKEFFLAFCGVLMLLITRTFLSVCFIKHIIDSLVWSQEN